MHVVPMSVAFEEKIASLEKSLSVVVREFDVDKEETRDRHGEELQVRIRLKNSFVDSTCSYGTSYPYDLHD